MRILTIVGFTEVVIAALTLASPASAAPCESLRSLVLPNVSVTLAEVVAAGQFAPLGRISAAAETLPAFCRVTATLTPTRDSEIKMEVWMLTQGWNGKLLGVGNGGWAGSVSW